MRYNYFMNARLGQHFLIDKHAIGKIIEALELSHHRGVIEIGPGKGALTALIIKELQSKHGSHARYIGIERDPALAQSLTDTFKTISFVSFITGDAREKLSHACAEISNTHPKFIIVGNIPYYITGILFRMLESLAHRPARIVLTVQREVAERATAREPHMNMLAAHIALWANAKILFSIDKTSFSPVPTVHSSVLLLMPQGEKDLLEENIHEFVTFLFTHPRKTTVNNLKSHIEKISPLIFKQIQNVGITEKTRSQELSIETIKMLARIVDK